MNHIEMMQLAEAEAAKSVCKRAQVGAVVVTVMGKVYTGWNLNAHEPSGCCEDENGKTLPDVIHAEDHALSFLLHPSESFGAVMYVTRQPCINCAHLLVMAGVQAVYYRDPDDKRDGLDWLVSHGVAVNGAWIVGQTWADRWQEGV